MLRWILTNVLSKSNAINHWKIFSCFMISLIIFEKGLIRCVCMWGVIRDKLIILLDSVWSTACYDHDNKEISLNQQMIWTLRWVSNWWLVYLRCPLDIFLPPTNHKIWKYFWSIAFCAKIIDKISNELKFLIALIIIDIVDIFGEFLNVYSKDRNLYKNKYLPFIRTLWLMIVNSTLYIWFYCSQKQISLSLPLSLLHSCNFSLW